MIITLLGQAILLFAKLKVLLSPTAIPVSDLILAAIMEYCISVNHTLSKFNYASLEPCTYLQVIIKADSTTKFMAQLCGASKDLQSWLVL